MQTRGTKAGSGVGRRGRASAWAGILTGLLCAHLAIGWPGLAAAVHDLDLFELEGDAIDDTGVAGDDADDVFGGTCSGDLKCFIADQTGNFDDIFVQGGSKDIHDVSSAGAGSNFWAHETGSAPDKDDILDAFAAAYVEPGTEDLIVYFGADRFAVNGSSQIGFWFFQNEVALNTDGSGTFSGVHEVGDVLVISDFTVGGTISTIDVYKWIGADCTTGGDAACSTALAIDCVAGACEGPEGTIFQSCKNNADCSGGAICQSGVCKLGGVPQAAACTADGDCLEEYGVECVASGGGTKMCQTSANPAFPLLLLGAGADCSVATPGDDACAIVNPEPISSPWPYTPKAPVSCSVDADCPGNVPGTCSGGTCADTIPTGGYFEGGVNLTELLHGNIGCFSSFLAETRSSHSEDARLFDFGLGSFPLCGITVDKTGDALGKVGDPASYTITITNSGSLTLHKDSIVDDVLGDLTDGTDANVVTSTCGASLAAGASCTITLTYTVLSGDPDPLVNTVTVHYNEESDLSGSDLSDSDDHSLNLFQPSVTVTKTGDSLSKVGDQVTYSFTIDNTSSSDSPDLILDSVSDDILGNLAGDAPAACDQLASGASCSFNVSYTVQSGDPDPLVNTVTVHYHPSGFTNDISDTDDHSLNLFQPSVEVLKTGDALSKVGDQVTYSFTINNTSSSDSPDLVLDSVGDDVLGDLAGDAPAACDQLAPGASCSFNVNYTVQSTDADPLVNTVTVHYHPTGFPNDVSDTDDHSLNLFQPSVTVVKGGDTLSKIGDQVTYTFTINNTSSSDAPDLILDSISDTVLGVLDDGEAPAACGQLASGGSCSFNVSYTILSTDPDPLANTVTVHYHPDGFPNDISDTDDHSVNLFQPSVSVEKTCGPSPVVVGDVVTYGFTVTNTGSSDSPDLALDSFSDTLLGDLAAAATNAGCDDLSPAESCSFSVNRTVLASDPDPLPNTVTVHYHPDGFPNDITDNESCEVDIEQICAHSPGFWKGGSGVPLWDQPTDTIAIAAGFYTRTCFPWQAAGLVDPTPGDTTCYLGLTTTNPQVGLTYLDILNLSVVGDVTIQIAFKYIAATLDQAAFGVPASTADVLLEVEDYFDAGGVDNADSNLTDLYTQPVGSDPSGAAKTAGQALHAALNLFFLLGDENCPF